VTNCFFLESSLYERVPEEDDAQFRAQQEADKEQEDALDAVARATQVPLSRRVRIRQQGTEALQTLDLRIRTAARIGSDDGRTCSFSAPVSDVGLAPCFFCRGCARMPRFLRCPCARPANNLRGHVACLSCMQSFFDKHANGDLKCPRCRETLERPENGDALIGTDDALEVLTGVPLVRLVDMDAAWRIAQQPSCDNIVSLDRLRGKLARWARQGVTGSSAFR